MAGPCQTDASDEWAGNSQSYEPDEWWSIHGDHDAQANIPHKPQLNPSRAKPPSQATDTPQPDFCLSTVHTTPPTLCPLHVDNGNNSVAEDGNICQLSIVAFHSHPGQPQGTFPSQFQGSPAQVASQGSTPTEQR